MLIVAPSPERLLSTGLRYIQKSLGMICKMKVPKKGAFMITITINFSSSKMLCGLSMMY